MNKEQEAELIGMMYDWKQGHTELRAIIAFINLVVKPKEKYNEEIDS